MSSSRLPWPPSRPSLLRIQSVRSVHLDSSSTVPRQLPTPQLLPAPYAEFMSGPWPARPLSARSHHSFPGWVAGAKKAQRDLKTGEGQRGPGTSSRSVSPVAAQALLPHPNPPPSSLYSPSSVRRLTIASTLASLASWSATTCSSATPRLCTPPWTPGARAGVAESRSSRLLLVPVAVERLAASDASTVCWQ